MAITTTARRAILLATLLAVGLLLAAAWWVHKSRTFQLLGPLVHSVQTTRPLVALTFDDGPSAPFTDSVLDILREHDAVATFFVTGGSLERHPELGRRIVAAGHELGNHTHTHRVMMFRTPATIRREVETTDSLIRAAGHGGAIHFRPPYGKRLLVLPWYLARTGRTTVLWTLEPDSWHREPAAMVSHVAAGVRPGAIILLHVELPSRRAEPAALPAVITLLREAGYGFVTVSELMAEAGVEDQVARGARGAP